MAQQDRSRAGAGDDDNKPRAAKAAAPVSGAAPAPDTGGSEDAADAAAREPSKAGEQPAPPPATAAKADAPPAKAQAVGQRPPRYMIQPRQAGGVQALSADLVVEQLRNAPGIEYIRTIEPPHTLALQDIGGGGGSGSGPLVLARMAEDKAVRLQSQAGPRLLVERDRPLTFGAAEPAPNLLAVQNPGVVVPHADGFEATVEVRNPAGQLLEGAEVYIYGSVWPAQGVTGADGRAVVAVPGESPDTVQALYVKPKLDHWGIWLSRPRLAPGGAVNAVEVKPIALPAQPLLGWGQKLMGLDKLPPGHDGAGVRIAIIDSGAAQDTHRNLHHVGPGRDVVGDGGDPGWTTDRIGHGSHCAGIIAGTPGDGDRPGMRGFAPAAEVHICRIFPGGRFSDLAGALDYCLEKEVDVVNLSLGGGDPSRIIEERLMRAKAAGIACIVAAGNSGGPVQFPASTPHVLAVAALGKLGEFPDNSYHAQQVLDGFGPERGDGGLFPAKFSCFGPEVDVCGPGVAIVSSLPADGFGAWDGTSMAAPHVTGLAALVLAHHPDFQGAFRARDAQRVEHLFGILKETATPLGFGDTARSGAGLPYAPRALGLPQTEAGSESVAAAAAAIQQLLAALSQQVGAAQRDTSPAAVSGPQAPAARSGQSGPAQPVGGRQRVPEASLAVARGPARADMALQSAVPPAPSAGAHTLQELRAAMMRARLL